MIDHLRPKAQPYHVPQLNNIGHAIIRSDQIDYQSLFAKVSHLKKYISFKSSKQIIKWQFFII